MRAQDLPIANLSQANSNDKYKLSSSFNQSIRRLPDGFHDVLERSLRYEREAAQDTVSPIKRNRHEPDRRDLTRLSNDRPHRDEYYQPAPDTERSRSADAPTEKADDRNFYQNEQKEPAKENYSSEKAPRETSEARSSDQKINNSEQSTLENSENRTDGDTDTQSNNVLFTAELTPGQSGELSSDGNNSEQITLNSEIRGLGQIEGQGQNSENSNQPISTTAPHAIEEQNKILQQSQDAAPPSQQSDGKPGLAAKLDEIATQLSDGNQTAEDLSNPAQVTETDLLGTGLPTASPETSNTANPATQQQAQTSATTVAKASTEANANNTAGAKAAGLNSTLETGKTGAPGQILIEGEGEVSSNNSGETETFTLSPKASKSASQNSTATTIANNASNTKALNGLINAGQQIASSTTFFTQLQNSDPLNSGLALQEDGIEGILPGSGEARINGLSQSSQVSAAQRPASLPSPAAQQLALQITQKAIGGNTQFEVRLNPPELGRVDVRLEFGRDGTHQAHLVVERSETLDLLQRDQRHLERALNASGFDLENGDLKFSLKEQGKDGAGSSDDQLASNSDALSGDGTAESDETAQGQSRSYRLNVVDIKV